MRDEIIINELNKIWEFPKSTLNKILEDCKLHNGYYNYNGYHPYNLSITYNDGITIIYYDYFEGWLYGYEKI